MDLSRVRRDFLRGGLRRSDLDPDPQVQFSKWFEQARKTDIADPTAMVLATVGPGGRPSQRTVLLKYYDESGYVFFTNLESRKARDMEENNRVSLLFVWLELDRQVQISGRAEKVSSSESAKYFMTRPKDSQIAAWVSSQSHKLSSRQVLLQKFQEMKSKVGEGKVPIPSFWGGYRVRPDEIEFWQGRKSRLHDRFVYKKSESGDWAIERLAP